METYTCKTNLKTNDNLIKVLEESDVIYNDLELSDGIQYTIYCSRNTAQCLKNKGFCLKN